MAIATAPARTTAPRWPSTRPPGWCARGRVAGVPGVGASIARGIAELAGQGSVPVLERLRERWPAVVIELAQLPKVGVTKARKIYQALAPAHLDAGAGPAR